MSDSVRPHRQQPTKLLCPWDSPGKNTGLGYHFLLQCMHACLVTSVVSNSVRPYGQQPTRLLCPWDSLGKNTGVGCFPSPIVKFRGSQKLYMGFLCGLAGKKSACNVGDLGAVPGLGRSPGGGRGNPFPYSCLENPHRQRSLVGFSPWGRRVGHD